MIDLVKTGIISASLAYQQEVLGLLQAKKNNGSYNCALEEYVLKQIVELSGDMVKNLQSLEKALGTAKGEEDLQKQAELYSSGVCTAMAELRKTVDTMESLVAKKHWPMPSYSDLLYGVI